MNKWKAAFFILIILMILAAAGVWFALQQAFSPSEEAEPFIPPEAEEADTDSAPSFIVETTPQDADQWLQRELEGEQDNVSIYIDDFVYVETSIQALGLEVPIEIRFIPEPAEGGNLWLREDGFQAGPLSLPAREVFLLMQDVVELPPWMELVPDEESIYADLEQLDTGNFQIDVEEVNLQEETIRLRMTEQPEAS
ncbi:YpmS family protein [Alkalicoccus urumqiensis]|uniref:DUF2140 domain-containing protein n=1 Tax=Alkalicoccus urumqiensis TaxID=1548213 RepID=A0A2P6MFC6_ALKUR|nr:YpmS family protein [Alkalicoccus urumqiensis]PRO64984.1 hypothetical protein C6I21_11060 [Alkalicoccus urumqiensis]